MTETVLIQSTMYIFNQYQNILKPIKIIRVLQLKLFFKKINVIVSSRKDEKEILNLD